MAVRVEIQRPAEGADRALVTRAANERIAEKAERLRFVSLVPMLCECSRQGCRAIVTISLEDYYEIRGDSGCYLTARGHATEGTELRRETPDYAVRRAFALRSGRHLSR